MTLKIILTITFDNSKYSSIYNKSRIDVLPKEALDRVSVT